MRVGRLGSSKRRVDSMGSLGTEFGNWFVTWKSTRGIGSWRQCLADLGDVLDRQPGDCMGLGNWCDP